MYHGSTKYWLMHIPQGTVRYMSYKVLKAGITASKHGTKTTTITHSPADDLQSAIWVIVWVLLAQLARQKQLDGQQTEWYGMLDGTDVNGIARVKVEMLIVALRKRVRVFHQFPTLSKVLEDFLIETEESDNEDYKGRYDELFKIFYSRASAVISCEEQGMKAWEGAS